MQTQIKIKTISPFYAPLSIALGVDQSSDEYRQLLKRLVQTNPRCQIIQGQDYQHDYDKIENDARDIRILKWQSEQCDGLTIHLFPNNVAVAELDLLLPEQLNAAQLATQSQIETRRILATIYEQFVADLRAFSQCDKNTALRLSEYPAQINIHWISRCLILSKKQGQQASLQHLLTQWLKDTQVPEHATMIIKGERNYSMTWLHYALLSDDVLVTDLHVETMILAQYYYTAQENCNTLLKQAIDSAYNGTNRVATEKKLAFARVVTRLHLIDFHEHKKFLNRYKRKLLDEILTSWDFLDVVDNGQRMIEICSARLQEADNKRRERSTVMTDLLLVTLSFFAVFELSLYLTEFSREMMSRPALDYNDENRSFFLQFIAGIDADIMFALGFGLTFALIIIYKIIKGK